MQHKVKMTGIFDSDAKFSHACVEEFTPLEDEGFSTLVVTVESAHHSPARQIQRNFSKPSQSLRVQLSLSLFVIARGYEYVTQV